jgi:hypothetical protein
MNAVLLVYLLLTFVVALIAQETFLNRVEYDTLKAMYDGTNGQNWTWLPDYSRNGYPWDFSDFYKKNPCRGHWQGLYCFPASTCLPDGCHIFSLSLNAYNINGTLPSVFNNFTELLFFYVGDNYIRGQLPKFPVSYQLQILNFSYNFLTGPIHDDWDQYPQLNLLYLSNNNFNGTIPETIYRLPRMQYLNLLNNSLTGTISNAIGNLSQSIYLSFSNNFLRGTLPASISKLIYIQQLYLSDNYLTGIIPEQLPSSVLELWLDSNYFHGTIPVSICACTNMSILKLNENSLSGHLPKCFGNLSSLQVVQLQDNEFSGHLLDELMFDPQRQYALSVIDISNNAFSGTFPSSVFQLPKLRSIAAVKNCFTGSLPTSICNGNYTIHVPNTNKTATYNHCHLLEIIALDGLQSSPACLNYYWNPFHITVGYYADVMKGSIPDCFWYLPNLTTFHLSGNGLTGSIPDLSQLYSVKLTDLSLTHNKLIGTIPSFLYQGAFQNFDVSNNKFVGHVLPFPNMPFEFSNEPEPEPTPPLNSTYISAHTSGLAEGASLDLEDNRLSGDVPAEFRYALGISMLSGNVFYCNSNQDLPHSDGSKDTYNCGANQFNSAVISFFVLIAVTITLFFMYIGFLRAYKYASNSEFYRIKLQPYVIMLSYVYEYCSKIIQLIQYINEQLNNGQEENIPVVYVKFRNIIQFLGTLFFIQRLCIIIVLYSLVVCLPIYLILYSVRHSPYSTYRDIYQWIVSAVFLTGDLPALILLIVWTILVLIVLICIYDYFHLDHVSNAVWVGVDIYYWVLDRGYDCYDWLVDHGCLPKPENHKREGEEYDYDETFREYNYAKDGAQGSPQLSRTNTSTSDMETGRESFSRKPKQNLPLKQRHLQHLNSLLNQNLPKQESENAPSEQTPESQDQLLQEGTVNPMFATQAKAPATAHTMPSRSVSPIPRSESNDSRGRYRSRSGSRSRSRFGSTARQRLRPYSFTLQRDKLASNNGGYTTRGSLTNVDLDTIRMSQMIDQMLHQASSPSPHDQMNTTRESFMTTHTTQTTGTFFQSVQETVNSFHIENLKSLIRNKQTMYYIQYYILYVLVFGLNITVSVSVNATYLYIESDGTIPYYGKTVIQLLMALFKIFWNVIAIRIMITWLKTFSMMKFLHSKNQNVTRLYVSMLLLNSLFAPCIATAFSDSSCFREIFFGAEEIITSYPLTLCLESYQEVIGFNEIITVCSRYVTDIYSTKFTPTYIYCYTCTSRILTAYIPVFIYFYAILLFSAPISYYFLATINKEYIPKFILMQVDGILRPQDHYLSYKIAQRQKQDTMSRQSLLVLQQINGKAPYKTTNDIPIYPDDNKKDPANSDDNDTDGFDSLQAQIDFNPSMVFFLRILRSDAIQALLTQHIIVLLTFGVNSPLLAVVMTISICVDCFLWQFIIVRYIKYHTKSSPFSPDYQPSEASISVSKDFQEERELSDLSKKDVDEATKESEVFRTESMANNVHVPLSSIPRPSGRMDETEGRSRFDTSSTDRPIMSIDQVFEEQLDDPTFAARTSMYDTAIAELKNVNYRSSFHYFLESSVPELRKSVNHQRPSLRTSAIFQTSPIQVQQPSTKPGDDADEIETPKAPTQNVSTGGSSIPVSNAASAPIPVLTKEEVQAEELCLHELNTIIHDGWECLRNARWLMFYCTMVFYCLVFFDYSGDDNGAKHAAWVPISIFVIMIVVRVFFLDFYMLLKDWKQGYCCGWDCVGSEKKNENEGIQSESKE